MSANQTETANPSSAGTRAPNKRSYSQRLTREKITSNKLYRTPPTPTLDEFFEMEKAFVIDGIAVSNISNDYLRANPQVGSSIPPYNSFKDKGVASYMKNYGLTSLLKKTGMVKASFYQLLGICKSQILFAIVKNIYNFVKSTNRNYFN